MHETNSYVFSRLITTTTNIFFSEHCDFVCDTKLIEPTLMRERARKMTAQPVSRPAAKPTTFHHTQKKLRNFINKVSSLVQRARCFLTVPGIRRT